MLTRTATVVRKNRRRSSTRSNRRGSAPTVLQPSNPSPIHKRVNSGTRTYLTPQPSPSKSVTFSFDSEGKASPSGERLSVRQSSLTPSQAEYPYKTPYYGSVVMWKDPDVDNSFSFSTSLCEACDESDSPCDFVYRAFVVFAGTWPISVLLGCLLALPLSMMVIGVKYLDECPRQPKIPIYLLVGGCFGTIKLMLTLCHQIRELRDDDEEDSHDDGEIVTMSKMANIGLNLFLAIWFVLGNYWFFNTWKPNFKAPLHEPRNWCDKSVYTYTFWQLIVCYILISVIVLLSLMFCFCFTCVRCVKDPEKG